MVEFVVNYECMLEATTLLGRMARPIAYSPTMGMLNTIANQIESTSGGYTNGSTETLARKVKDAARRALLATLKGGLAVASNYFLPGSGPVAGYLANQVMDVD
jgi:hypothetical protein